MTIWKKRGSFRKLVDARVRDASDATCPREATSSPSTFSYRGKFFSMQLLFGRYGGEAAPPFKLHPSAAFAPRPFARRALEEVRPQVEASIRSAMEALLKE
jgi:hypothetical protein